MPSTAERLASGEINTGTIVNFNGYCHINQRIGGDREAFAAFLAPFLLYAVARVATWDSYWHGFLVSQDARDLRATQDDARYGGCP